jgi:hypothetical protein
MAEVVEFPGTPSEDAETGTVALPGHAEVIDGEVVEGVVVDERRRLEPSVVLLPVQVVRVVVEHEHTKTAGRHVAYIPLGAAVVVKRFVGQPDDAPVGEVHADRRGDRQLTRPLAT